MGEPRVMGNSHDSVVSGGLSTARFTPALPVPCFLTAAALAPCSPSSRWRKEVMFWTIWWEVGKAVPWVRSVHLTQKDC